MAEERPTVCVVCGAVATTPPITWVFETDPRRGSGWVCQACAREHLREIEAKLDREWW